MSEAIKVTGLTEFSKRLKEVDAGLPKVLRVTLNRVADVIVGPTRARMPSRTGRAKSSVKAASLRDAVRVSEGGKSAPHTPWLDYGGEGRRRGRPPKRPFIKAGRYLYPTYFEKRDSGELVGIMNVELVGLVKSSGLEVT